MSDKNEREVGAARMLLDQMKINNRDIEEAIVRGLVQAGFEVDIIPGKSPTVSPVSTVKVYRKVMGAW